MVKKKCTCASVASRGTGNLVNVDGRMNSSRDQQQILDGNVGESVTKLKLRQGWIFQQDKDPKHCSKSTEEFMQRHRDNVLEWPFQSPTSTSLKMYGLI